jgi:signal transduction histidine kinase
LQVCAARLFPATVRVPFADIFQFLLLLLVIASLLVNVRRKENPAARLFWLLMTVGATMWAAVASFWIWFEVIKKTSMPEQYFGDLVLFLHLIPMMSAVCLAPQVSRRATDLFQSTLDFFLLACWWVYLYVDLVETWNRIEFVPYQYGRNFNVVYHLQGAVFIASMLWMVSRCRGRWRTVFIHYSLASILYGVASALINHAIYAKQYQSGSLYDLPLVLAMTYFAWSGFRAYELNPQPEGEAVAGERPLPTWLTIVAVLLIPVLAFWSNLRPQLPESIRDFRVLLALVAMFVLTSLLFLRQHLMHRELATLLSHERRVLGDLQRIQSELLQSEKLASLGRLVAGAAHEINNPLTAILGYADLLVEESVDMPAHRSLADKVRQQAIRTRALVANLLAFARQKPGTKRAADLNLVVTNACQLQSLKEASVVRLERDLQQDLPAVLCDESQIMQVVMHLLSNAYDSVEAMDGGMVLVRTRHEEGTVRIEVEDTGAGIEHPERVFDPFYTTKVVGQGTGLGLSASYGIVHEHGGEIACRNLPDGGACFTIILPLFQQRVLADPREAEVASR